MREEDKNGVEAVLARARELEEQSRARGGSSELIAEAVLVCAGKIQELTTPESAHSRALWKILDDFDIGSRAALDRVRGVLKAVAWLG